MPDKFGFSHADTDTWVEMVSRQLKMLADKLKGWELGIKH